MPDCTGIQPAYQHPSNSNATPRYLGRFIFEGIAIISSLVVVAMVAVTLTASVSGFASAAEIPLTAQPQAGWQQLDRHTPGVGELL